MGGSFGNGIMDIPHVPFDLWPISWHPPSGSVLLWATAWLNAWANTWVNTVSVPDFAGVVHGWQEGLTHWGSSWHLGDTFGALLAQAGRPQQFDQNILADLSRAWNNFIKTGQAAALGIGLFIGYMFRVFTSSG